MEWIEIKEISKHKPSGNILIWQENLSDPESSRFQRAVWYDKSHIDVYPLTNRTTFYYQDNETFKGYDLDGDLCLVTHFSIISKPNNNEPKQH